MKKLYELTKGYKTKITSVLALLVVVAKMLGWLTPDQFQAILTVLGAFGAYSLHDAIERLNDN